MYKKIQINSHLSRHGNRAIEWTYHFPLRPGLRIIGEMEIAFPEEKVSAATRQDIADSNLHTTRLSLADAATKVRRQSLSFYTDSLLLRDSLQFRAEKSFKGDDYAAFPLEVFFERASEYWSKDFTQRLGVYLLSDLKSIVAVYRTLLRKLADGEPISTVQLAEHRRKIVSSFRSAMRVVKTRFVWKSLCEEHRKALLRTEPFAEQNISLNRFRKGLDESAEFAIYLVCRALADFQTIIEWFEKEMPTEKLNWDRRTVLSWVDIFGGFLAEYNLPSFDDVAKKHSLATKYFERMRMLKRKHYKIWNLHLNLEQSEKQWDFLTGGLAAGVSAAFAFYATYLWIVYHNSGGNALAPSFGQMGAVALTLFALGNVVVYILKDRLKEWLRLKLRTKVHAGIWSGKCGIWVGEDPYSKQEKLIEVAELKRDIKWVKEGQKWVFRIVDTFEVEPDAVLADARIVKQKWVIPLDDILDGLDDAKQTLKVPSKLGKPRIVKLLKHSVFPYRLNVTVLPAKPGELSVLDHDAHTGKVVTAGNRISHID